MSRAGWALIVLGLVGGVPTIAFAQCNYTSLTSGSAAATSATPQYFVFNQTAAWWSAVAVRSAAGDNWDLGVYQDAAGSPACVANLAAGSSRTTLVDFVVGDFNIGHNPLGIGYVRASLTSGTGTGTVEWDDGGGPANTLSLNTPLVTRTTGPADVIEIWDVNLTSGVPYTITFNPTGADLKLMLFRSRPGAYFVGRDSALIQVGFTTTITPSVSGFYGVLVVNDDGAAGSYSLGVGTCMAPETLVSGASVNTGGLAEKPYVVDQHATFWTAVGARGTSNWNVEAYLDPAGSYPACLGTQAASSNSDAPTVDFIVANFNSMIAAPFYARVHLDQDLGSGSATVEWDDGMDSSDILLIDSPVIIRDTGPSDVLECWDVYLESGTSYEVRFHSTGPNVRALVFPPSVAWAGRSSASAQFSANPNTQVLVASQSGWHGLVVVNESGASGKYYLKVSHTGALAVDVPIPAVTELRGITPNPAHGLSRILFSMHEPGPVSFEILDVAGRVVSRVGPRRWDPGNWSTAWTLGREQGKRLAAGIYFLRMRVGNEALKPKKFTLLE